MKFSSKKILLYFLVILGTPVSILFYAPKAHSIKPTKRADLTFSIDKAIGILNEVDKLIKKGKTDDALKLIQGAIGLIDVDPTPAKFFDGRITVNYDSSLLSLQEFGWFGDWGIDPSLPSPPTNTTEDVEWFLQVTPNPQLLVNSTIIPPLAGSTISTLQVEYDWGSEGHIASTNDDFNFFGIRFSVLEEITFGEFKSLVMLPENYPTSELNFNNCIPQGSEIIERCGVPVNEPSSSLFSFLALGTLGVVSSLKRKLNSSQFTKKELAAKN